MSSRPGGVVPGRARAGPEARRTGGTARGTDARSRCGGGAVADDLAGDAAEAVQAADARIRRPSPP
ncbi:hypothetical protein AB0F39_31615 [Streptomyces murinus]|uniref:hypothetical protein n=1 Tax=Streptomyces murinus TaxID=33900 RepID=UPI003408D00E